jgi:probable rRNA maturation factor
VRRTAKPAEPARRNLSAAIRVRRVRTRVGPDPRTVARRAAKLLALLELEAAELSIVLCDDEFIRELNRTYRGRDLPTDVLSFPQDGGPGVPRRSVAVLGDVVISIDTAARQARSRRATLSDEVTALLVHGVLHLVGLDHEAPAEASEMAREAARLEKTLNGKKRP